MAVISRLISDFTQVSNEILNSKELSWKAKGLYCYLLSKQGLKDWNYSYKGIASQGIGGEELIKSGVRELVGLDLLLRIPRRNSVGSFFGWDWILHPNSEDLKNTDPLKKTEVPKTRSTENPKVVKPEVPETRPTGNHHYISNTNLSNTNLSNTKRYSCPTSNEMRLSQLLIDKILVNNPNHKKPNLQSWAGHVDKMIRIDKRTVVQIEDLINWSQSDPFWSGNILSTEKLRKQFDTLTLQSKNKNRGKRSYNQHQLKEDTSYDDFKRSEGHEIIEEEFLY